MRHIKIRPGWVTFLAWFFIGVAIFNFIILLIAQIDYGKTGNFLWYNNENMNPAWLLLDMFIFMILGIGLINGKNWARILTIIYLVLIILVHIFVSLPSGDNETIMSGLFGIILSMIIILYLSLNKKALIYLTKNK